MNLNITVNEAAGCPPATAGTFWVRAKYNEADAGKLYGPFATREAAEHCVTTLAARDGVLSAAVEEAN